MKMPTYNATPGLDAYPESERYKVYRSIHHRLMSGDIKYKRRWVSYMVCVVCAAIVPVCGLLAGGILSVILLIGLLVLSVPLEIYLAARWQIFMNQCIGQELRLRAGS